MQFVRQAAGNWVASDWCWLTPCFLFLGSPVTIDMRVENAVTGSRSGARVVWVSISTGVDAGWVCAHQQFAVALLLI